MNPGCYECAFRGDFPGSAHSTCRHPELGQLHENEFGVMVDMVAGKYREAARKLNIQGDPAGIRKGWFLWPANFDPVWLISCNGFTQKEEKKP